MAGRAGRSMARCALTEFQVEAVIRFDHPDQPDQTEIRKATADVNPPERELEKIFDNHRDEAAGDGPDRVCQSTAIN